MTMFRYSTLSGGENAPVPSGAELIEIVRRRPVWRGKSRIHWRPLWSRRLAGGWLSHEQRKTGDGRQTGTFGHGQLL